MTKNEGYDRQINTTNRDIEVELTSSTDAESVEQTVAPPHAPGSDLPTSSNTIFNWVNLRLKMRCSIFRTGDGTCGTRGTPEHGTRGTM